MIDQIKRAQKQFRLLCWINGLTVDFDWVVGDALQHLVIHGDATSSFGFAARASISFCFSAAVIFCLGIVDLSCEKVASVIGPSGF